MLTFAETFVYATILCFNLYLYCVNKTLAVIVTQHRAKQKTDKLNEH